MDSLTALMQRAGLIPSALLVVLFYALLRGARASMWRIALLSLPGTAAHECAHFLIGLLLWAQPHGLTLWPKADGRGWRLGAVSFGRIGLLNGAWVALAPLLLLPLAWLGFVHVFAALPSWQDLKLGSRSLLFYALLGVGVGLVYMQR